MRTPIKAEMHTDKSILSLNILMTNVTVLLEGADPALPLQENYSTVG
jgi:hypothetical protein